MKHIVALTGFFFILGLLPLNGQIDSQWRGPNRDGVYPGEKLQRQWPAAGPVLLWSIKGLGDGFSSPAVTSDRVYLTGLAGSEGYLFAFDLKGQQLWKVSYGPDWAGSNPGARTTPTVVGDRIYLISAKGRVACFNKSGKPVWSLDMMQAFGARNIEWGITESPLIDGDRIFCTPGGSQVMVAALDRRTGKILWKVKGNGETSAYCSPVLIQRGKRQLLLTMTAESLVGLDATSGEYLWREKHITDYNVHPNTPLYHEGKIYIVSGYGSGGQMFQLAEDGGSVKRLWSQKNLDSQMGAVILMDGFIYGSGHNRRGWTCLDWQSGKVKFTARQIGNKGNIILSDGLLYCYSERGDMALVRPNPEKFEVISSFRVKKGSGPHWAHPVIKNGRLYIRHGDAMMVYQIGR